MSGEETVKVDRLTSPNEESKTQLSEVAEVEPKVYQNDKTRWRI